MHRSSHRGAVVLLVFSAALFCGAPCPVYPAAPRGVAAGAAPSPGREIPAVNDGFQETLGYFQITRKKASEFEALLRELDTAAGTTAPGDRAQRQAIFLKKLRGRYPGATFDGITGSIPIQENFVARFSGDLKVESIRELGPITVDYLVNTGQIQLSDGVNSVTIVLNQADPARSLFIDVTIPGMREAAAQVVNNPDRKRIATGSPETAVLNDAYQLLSLTRSQGMDIYAITLMGDPALQQETINIAARGYQERHPEEYQPGDPARKKQKAVDPKPNRPAERRFYEGFLKTGAFILLVACLLWLVTRGTRLLKKRSLKRVEKKRRFSFSSLSPMVTSVLNGLGRSLWGRNLPWARNYHIYERSNRWILCDGREDKDEKVFQARTRIEVSLRSSYFKIKITRLNGAKAHIWLACDDLSKQGLLRGLEEISLELTNPSGRDYGVDDDET